MRSKGGIISTIRARVDVVSGFIDGEISIFNLAEVMGSVIELFVMGEILRDPG